MSKPIPGKHQCLSVVLTAAILLSSPAQEEASAAVTIPLSRVVTWFGEHLLGNALDFLWDSATGKPDVRKLGRRLDLVEDSLRSHDAELARAIRELKASVTANTTQTAFRTMAREAISKMEARVTKLEGRVTHLEAEVSTVSQSVRQNKHAISNNRFAINSNRNAITTNEGRLNTLTSQATVSGSEIQALRQQLAATQERLARVERETQLNSAFRQGFRSAYDRNPDLPVTGHFGSVYDPAARRRAFVLNEILKP